jgi:hypothetical protein
VLVALTLASAVVAFAPGLAERRALMPLGVARGHAAVLAGLGSWSWPPS